MSYLERLMAQTGMEFAAAAPPPGDDAASLPIEIEEVREARPQAAAPPEGRSTAARTASAIEPPINAARAKESVAAALPAPARDHAPAAPEAHASAPRPQARAFDHPEVRIEQRVVERVREVAAANPAATRAVQGVEPRATPPDAPRHKLIPSSEEAAARPAPRQLTLVEVRNWVAATPAPEERPRPDADAGALAFAPPHMEPHAAARAGREASPEHGGAVSVESQHVDLSIGTVEVTIEVPPQPVPAAPLPRPLAPSPAAPRSSRLARRYVRL